jgi:hypothetical protein
MGRGGPAVKDLIPLSALTAPNPCPEQFKIHHPKFKIFLPQT